MIVFHPKSPNVLILLVLAGLTSVAPARAVSIMVGDNDGFGFGAATVPDGADLVDLTIPGDRRSGAEAAATNGAQQTDYYTAIFDPLPLSVDVIFPLANPLLSATLTVDMGGFQSSDFGLFDVAFNGVAQPGLFNFDDGAVTTMVREFILGPTAIDNANVVNQFVLTISRGASDDAVAFDYFRLDGQEIDRGPDIEAIPEPGTFLLLGTGVLALAAWRAARRRRAAA